LIVALLARIDALVAENTALRTRVAEFEAKLGLPPDCHQGKGRRLIKA